MQCNLKVLDPLSTVLPCAAPAVGVASCSCTEAAPVHFQRLLLWLHGVVAADWCTGLGSRLLPVQAISCRCRRIVAGTCSLLAACRYPCMHHQQVTRHLSGDTRLILCFSRGSQVACKSLTGMIDIAALGHIR